MFQASLKYENLPTMCSTYNVIGHTSSNCQKNQQARSLVKETNIEVAKPDYPMDKLQDRKTSIITENNITSQEIIMPSLEEDTTILYNKEEQTGVKEIVPPAAATIITQRPQSWVEESENNKDEIEQIDTSVLEVA